VVKRKIPSPRRESNPRTPTVQPVAQRYTDWAVAAPHFKILLWIFTFIQPQSSRGHHARIDVYVLVIFYFLFSSLLFLHLFLCISHFPLRILLLYHVLLLRAHLWCWKVASRIKDLKLQLWTHAQHTVYSLP
jgi:hypothetical protein